MSIAAAALLVMVATWQSDAAAAFTDNHQRLPCTSTPRAAATRDNNNAYPPDFTVFDDDDDEAARLRPTPDITTADESEATKFLQAPQQEAPSPRPHPRRIIRNGRSRRNKLEGGNDDASWMQRNSAFANSRVVAEGQPQGRRGEPLPDKQNRRRRRDTTTTTTRTFRQDFRGTRVFCQNLPPDATWQDLKDHFKKVVGNENSVVFASVSADPDTGKSKCCGVVQFETTAMAQTVIATVQKHPPLNGYQLHVREDVQEDRSGGMEQKSSSQKGPTPPSKWKCANEDNAAFLSPDEMKTIRALIKARDDARRRRKYEAADNMREQLKLEYHVHVDDRLHMWWTTMDGNQPPQSIQDMKGEGRWGNPKTAWRQIPTTPENDACVNPDLVNGLLKQRDIARREKDFATADALLEEARTSPDNDLELRIHDESRTWRIWTDVPPPRPVAPPKKTAGELCVEIIEEYAPSRMQEMKHILDKFRGREYQILKRLKQTYKLRE